MADGHCLDCGDELKMGSEPGRYTNMDGTSHEETHVRRLRALTITFCEKIFRKTSNIGIQDVEMDENRCDGFSVVRDGVRYHFRCSRMEPVR